MKDYKYYSEILKNNKIEKSLIKNSEIYKKLCDLTENIEIAYFQSMSNKNDPSKIRLRSDKFLSYATEKNKSFLISGFQWLNKKMLFIFQSDFWFEYTNSISNSNSIITFDFNDLIEFYKNNENSIIYKKSKINNKIYYIPFLFHDLNSIDDEIINEFIIDSDKNNDDIKNIINTISYSRNYPTIPKKYREIIKEIYGINCSIRKSDENKCRCSLSPIIDGDIQHHHLVPKDYFLKNNKIINWDIIHSVINIVPLCYYCHKDVHSREFDRVNSKFKIIIDIYKKTNRYDSFIEYLRKNTQFQSVDELLNFYLK